MAILDTLLQRLPRAIGVLVFGRDPSPGAEGPNAMPPAVVTPTPAPTPAQPPLPESEANRVYEAINRLREARKDRDGGA